VSFDDALASAEIDWPGTHILLAAAVDTSEGVVDFGNVDVVGAAGTTQSVPNIVHRSTSYQHSHFPLQGATQKRQRMGAAEGRKVVAAVVEGAVQGKVAASSSD
jgi:hypothetical protein